MSQDLDSLHELAKLYPRKDEQFYERSITDRANDLRIPLDKKKLKK